MTRVGTCRWAHRIERIWRGGDDGRLVQVRDVADTYHCQWLDQAGDLPPPVQRMHGGFEVRAKDCDHCSRYEAAGAALLAQVLQRRRP